jgi:hypothetical protein
MPQDVLLARSSRTDAGQVGRPLPGAVRPITVVGVRHDARVSIIVEFFAAPDDASAARVLRTGPRRAFESLSFGNVDPEGAVIEWECLLSGGNFEELVEAAEPRIIAGQNDDGCVVFAVSPCLSAALAEAERSGLEDAAVAWSVRHAEGREVMDAEIASVILGGLAALVASARGQVQGVYCWVA